MCAWLTHKHACTKYEERINQRLIHFANRKSRRFHIIGGVRWNSAYKTNAKLQAISIIIKPQSSPFQLLPVFSSHGPIYPHSLNTGKHIAATWPLPVPLPLIPFSSSSSLKFKKEKIPLYPYIKTFSLPLIFLTWLNQGIKRLWTLQLQAGRQC